MTNLIQPSTYTYDNITEEHQAVALECAKICDQYGLGQVALVIKQQFKIEEPETYDLQDSEIYKMVQGTGIGISPGGYVHEDGGMRYPFVVLSADVRTFDAWLANLKEELRS